MVRQEGGTVRHGTDSGERPRGARRGVHRPCALAALALAACAGPLALDRAALASESTATDGASAYGPWVPGGASPLPTAIPTAGSRESSTAPASASAAESRAAEAKTPLGPPPKAARGEANRTPDRAGASGDGDEWMLRTGGALALVLALIFGARAVVKRAAGRAGLLGQLGAGGRAPSGILEVLGRYPAGRGQTLVLLRMDRRALLLSQSNAGFSLLAQVDDPDEMASLLVQARDAEGDSMAERFRGLLRSMERDPLIMGEADEAGEALAGAAPRGTLEPEPLRAAGDPIVSLRRRLSAARGATP